MNADRRADWRAALRLASLSLVLIGSFLLPGPARAAYPGQNGKIAFVQSSAGGDVYTVNPDGSGMSQLTEAGAAGRDLMLQWSPDGRKLAFTRCIEVIGGGDCDIYVVRADGTGLTNLTNNLAATEAGPTWSPDGTKIAFFKTVPATGADLFIMNADGSDPTMVSDVGGSLLRWSPAGHRLAIDAVSDIFLIDVDGTNLVNLTNNNPFQVEATNPNWSPDATRIVFSETTQRNDEGDPCCPDIFTMNADGSGQANRTNEPDCCGWPAWSPDGTRIVFSYTGPVGTPLNTLTTMNPDGTLRVPLGVTGTWADWQPLPSSVPAPPYDRPRLASPLSVSLVPVHRNTLSSSQCQARGGTPSTHGAPLSFTSCNPPAYRPGTVARLGPSSEANAQLAASYGDANSANGDQANLTIRATVTDVQTPGGADYAPNSSGPDVTLTAQLRLTDTYNGPSQSEPGTTVNFDYDVPVDCAPTAGTLGSTCEVDTTADAVTPGAIRENESTVLQVLRVKVDDSGPNAVRGDADDKIFATHGIFVP